MEKNKAKIFECDELWSQLRNYNVYEEYKTHKKNIDCRSGNYEGVLHYSNIKTAIQRLFNKVVSIFTRVRQKKSD